MLIPNTRRCRQIIRFRNQYRKQSNFNDRSQRLSQRIRLQSRSTCSSTPRSRRNRSDQGLKTLITISRDLGLDLISETGDPSGDASVIAKFDPHTFD